MRRGLLWSFLLFALCPIWVNPVFGLDASYIINPGDVLQITVWKEDGLDRETLVLPDGTIAFPLVGTLMAKGKTVAQLRQALREKLASDIPDAPIAVVVKSTAGNVFNVIGQANKPGEITSGHPVTVMQALSMAGGLTPYAATSQIKILHMENGKEVAIPFPYDDIVKGKSLEKDIILAPGDVVVIPDASLF